MRGIGLAADGDGVEHVDGGRDGVVLEVDVPGLEGVRRQAVLRDGVLRTAHRLRQEEQCEHQQELSGRDEALGGSGGAGHGATGSLYALQGRGVSASLYAARTGVHVCGARNGASCGPGASSTHWFAGSRVRIVRAERRQPAGSSHASKREAL